ncbi:hypothetical protein [Agromyces laixinhei]|uniref:hypothetical protein n=1 Tax=Agromyces laixinhei TaxID=2585717 RepID=UPI0012EDC3A2|nr:hypothetical protein [Agromyces laixinhei]
MRTVVRGLALVGTLAFLLSGCSATAGANGMPPPTSQADANERMANCLEESGWTVKVDPAGGIESEYPSEQEDAYSADVGSCFDSTGVNQVRQLSQDEYREGYELMQETLQCLRGEGLDLPDAPSYQQFADSNAAYSPYRDVPDERFDEMIAACPQPQLW